MILKHIRFNTIAGLFLLFFSCNEPKEAENKVAQASYYKPWISIPAIFETVQMAAIFPDSKTFVDYTPNSSPEVLNERFLKESKKSDFDLKSFVYSYFDPPAVVDFPAMEISNIAANLNKKWDYLTREVAVAQEYSTLIAMPNQYVVPGGRFREVYYWDSYFTMIGLGVSGRTDLVKSMVDNFAYLIDEVGFIPNGNRTYYLGRSQPPFFASMVMLYAGLTSVNDVIKYLPAIQEEYNFWMSGASKLSKENPAHRRVIWLEEDVVMNRYWDDLDFARPESHREDVELAEHLEGVAKKQLYRNLRAGAESGWDYSTRWFSDKEDFSTIQTTEIIPVDLNSLLYKVEQTLSKLYKHNGEIDLANKYGLKANKRKEAINKYCWNNDLEAYADYIFSESRVADQLTLAGFYPLYFKIAPMDKGVKQIAQINDFLMPGGLVTTTINSGQQWDAPNGWAPLQWIGIKGLSHYGNDKIANEIANRWIRVNKKVYKNTGKMMEKYNVMDTTLMAGGGEYPTQDGFGWSNGVLLGLMTKDKVVY